MISSSYFLCEDSCFSFWMVGTHRPSEKELSHR
jgi:hypothetical protein